MYNIISYLIAIATIGGIFVYVGMFKGKIKQNASDIKALGDKIEPLASKSDLEAAINRSNEILKLMKERAEEDRAKGQGQWREFHSKTAEHAERLSALETQQTSLNNSLNEIRAYFREMEKDIKEILRKLPQ